MLNRRGETAPMTANLPAQSPFRDDLGLPLLHSNSRYLPTLLLAGPDEVLGWRAAAAAASQLAYPTCVNLTEPASLAGPEEAAEIV